MEFEPSYFEGEIRDDFYIEPKMKRAWAAQIEVMEEIRRVCKKLGIPFFGEFGTILGTVRHKGYIPWDDDLDVGMLRQDYMRFLELAPQELGEGFELKSLYNDPTHDIVKARIITGRKMNFTPEYLERFHNCPFVIGVDIFPVDYIPRDEEQCKLQKQLIRLVMTAVASVPEEPPYDESVWKMIEKLEQMLGMTIDRTLPLRHELKKIADQLSAMHTAEDSDHVCSMLDFVLGSERYRIGKECYDGTIEMPFENTTIPIPVGYEEILTAKYTENYMTPIRGAAGHEYPFYRKQERGLATEIEKEFGVTLTQEELDELMEQKIFG